MKPLCWSLIISGMFLILYLGWTPALSADDWTNDLHFQVMLGATHFSDLTVEEQSTADSTVEAESEISLMPELGICGGIPILKGSVDLGLEGGVLFGWRNDDVTAVGHDGTVRLHIDNQLYLFDFFVGPYASAMLGKRIRIYAGAGPLLMVGQYDKSSDEEVSEESGHIKEDERSMISGAGLYARTGIEYKFEDGSFMGLCVRGFKSRLDFEHLPEDTDVDGLQFLITFSPSLSPTDINY
jgi:hypothetical protein